MASHHVQAHTNPRGGERASDDTPALYKLWPMLQSSSSHSHAPAVSSNDTSEARRARTWWYSAMATLRVARRLLLLSILAVSLACSGAAPPPVYDTDGHELSTDATYYVLPASRGHGGGLTMAPNVLPCPLFVAQEADEHRRGFPVRFTPLGAGAGAGGRTAVRLSSDVRIRFAAYTTCVQSTEWHVAGGLGEPLTGRHHVVTGPVFDPAVPSGREKVFRIERHGGAAYKLVSCREHSCQDLGVFRDLKGAWLGANEPVHAVVFKKAPAV